MIAVLVGAQQRLGIKKDVCSSGSIVLVDNGSGGVFPDPAYKAFALIPERIEQGMILISTVAYPGLARSADLADKGPFGSIAVGEKDFEKRP